MPRQNNQLEGTISERRAYLKQIETQIEAVSEAGNNRLFQLNSDIDRAERELAKVMHVKFKFEQQIREHQSTVTS